MPRYVYRAHPIYGIVDLRFVLDGYVLQPGEVDGIADTLPAVPMPARDKTALVNDADYQDLVGRLVNATPAQIKTYVQNNVTDLPSAKVLLVKILLLLSRAV